MRTHHCVLLRIAISAHQHLKFPLQHDLHWFWSASVGKWLYLLPMSSPRTGSRIFCGVVPVSPFDATTRGAYSAVTKSSQLRQGTDPDLTNDHPGKSKDIPGPIRNQVSISRLWSPHLTPVNFRVLFRDCPSSGALPSYHAYPWCLRYWSVHSVSICHTVWHSMTLHWIV